MRVTIDYVNGKEQHISFENTEFQDSALFAKIIDRVIKRERTDATYQVKGSAELSVNYKDAGINSLTVEGDTDLIQRLIYLTVANHFHMLKQEIILESAETV